MLDPWCKLTETSGSINASWDNSVESKSCLESEKSLVVGGSVNCVLDAAILGIVRYSLGQDWLVDDRLTENEADCTRQTAQDDKTTEMRPYSHFHLYRIRLYHCDYSP